MAASLLGLSLQKARDLGIERVLVVCDKDNIGSFKTIVKNGGTPTGLYRGRWNRRQTILDRHIKRK